MGIQKRRHPRFPVSWNAVVLINNENVPMHALLSPANLNKATGANGQEAQQQHIKAKIADVSQSGVTLFCDIPLDEGAEHEIVIAIPTSNRRKVQYIEASCKVVHHYLTKNDNFRMGLEIQGVDPASEKILVDFLRKEASEVEWLWCKVTKQHEYVKGRYGGAQGAGAATAPGQLPPPQET